MLHGPHAGRSERQEIGRLPCERSHLRHGIGGEKMAGAGEGDGPDGPLRGDVDRRADRRDALEVLVEGYGVAALGGASSRSTASASVMVCGVYCIYGAGPSSSRRCSIGKLRSSSLPDAAACSGEVRCVW